MIYLSTIIQKTSVFLTGDKDEIRLVGAAFSRGTKMKSDWLELASTAARREATGKRSLYIYNIPTCIII